MLLGMFLPNYCIAGVLSLVLPLLWWYEFDAASVGSKELTEWSGTRSISITAAKRSYLGPFGNDSIRVLAKELPEHDTIVVELRVYILGSWDGVQDDDRLLITLDGRDTLLYTTFSNTLIEQNYPDWRGGRVFPRRTGSTEVDVTGWIFSEPRVFHGPLDAAYTMVFRVPHSSRNCGITFKGLLTDVRPIPANEAWGIGSVRIGLMEKVKPPAPLNEPMVYPGR